MKFNWVLCSYGFLYKGEEKVNVFRKCVFFVIWVIFKKELELFYFSVLFLIRIFGVGGRYLFCLIDFKVEIG